MDLMKTILLVLAITMALSITLTMRTIIQPFSPADSTTMSKGFAMDDKNKKLIMPSKRLSRFLAEQPISSPRGSASHCNKNEETCSLLAGQNYTCCNNKCLDLSSDANNCGSCGNKCLYPQTCCGGKCVNLSLDPANCGKCNNQCLQGEHCAYGMCNYS